MDLVSFLKWIGEQYGFLALLVIFLIWNQNRQTQSILDKMHDVYKTEIDRVAQERNKLQDALLQLLGANRLSSIPLSSQDTKAAPVEIQMGMNIEEAMKAKGNPKSKVNLGSKTILMYDDMKLIFEDNKLVDVQ